MKFPSCQMCNICITMGSQSTLVVVISRDRLRVVTAKIPAGMFPLLARGQNARVGLTPKFIFYFLW